MTKLQPTQSVSFVEQRTPTWISLTRPLRRIR